VEGVTSVFYGADFITVTKAGDANWAHIKPEVFSIITQAVTSGETIVTTVEAGADGEESVEDSLSYNEDDDEVVGMIKELLETRIRPAIQEDGGDIELRGFEDGIVMLKLRGACRTCDSSTVTLKNGIESMLMHYVSFALQLILGFLTDLDSRLRRSRVLSRLWMRRRLFLCTSSLGLRRSCASRRALLLPPLLPWIVPREGLRGCIYLYINWFQRMTILVFAAFTCRSPLGPETRSAPLRIYAILPYGP
jgi:Fe-S cluster biogenesis protein NfuA